MKLKTFLAAIRRYWKTFVVVTGVVFALGLTWILLTPAKFVSTTQLMVSIQGSTTAAAYQNDQVVAGRVNSYIALLTSDVVSQRVIDKLGLSMTTPEFAAKVSATNVPPKTSVIGVAVTDESPARARLLAETLATEFISYTDALETPTGEDGQKVRTTVISVASEPRERRAERIVLGVLAALAALLLGSVAVWIRSLIDPVVRTADRAAVAAGVPQTTTRRAGATAHQAHHRRPPLLQLRRRRKNQYGASRPVLLRDGLHRPSPAYLRRAPTSLRVRVRTKIKRELLRAPIIRPWSDNRYRARLRRHAENLPWITSDRFDIYAELRDHGIAVRDATTTIPAAVLEVADRFVVDRLGETTQKPLEITLPARMPEIALPNDLPDMPADSAPLYEWGLAEENLDLAERYIGLPVFFLGVAVRRERADGNADFYTRRWHMDIDDRRMLKIIVYLNDVGDGRGPFEYLNRNASDHAARIFRYSAGHISDAAMARVVPAADWVQVTGPRLTTMFVDPRRIFHRVQPPTKADRYSLTLTYISTTPLFESFRECRLSPATLAGLSNELTPRQRRAAMVE